MVVQDYSCLFSRIILDGEERSKKLVNLAQFTNRVTQIYPITARPGLLDELIQWLLVLHSTSFHPSMICHPPVKKPGKTQKPEAEAVPHQPFELQQPWFDCLQIQRLRTSHRPMR